MASRVAFLAIGLGFAAGWAVRSLADSPQGAGVKLLEIALDTKERLGRWVAVEAERLEDMLAEARLKAEPDVGRPGKAANNGSDDKGRAESERGKSRRRSPRPAEREQRA